MTIVSQARVIAEAVAEERTRAVNSGVSLSVVEAAVGSTQRALASARGTRKQLQRRVSAYFWAVIRRTVVRRRTDPHVTARFVLAAVVDDLRDSGRDNRAVWREIESNWSDRVPGDVLAEYRERLCA